MQDLDHNRMRPLNSTAPKSLQTNLPKRSYYPLKGTYLKLYGALKGSIKGLDKGSTRE